MRRLLSGIDRALAAAVSTLVVGFLLSMLVLSFTQVILRNFFDSGIGWADVVSRHLVLGVGMFGAVLAARQGRQISIDVLSRMVPPRGRKVLSWVIGLFTIFVSLALARAALVFVASERSFGSEIFPGLKAWFFEVVIPVGFLLIAIQVLLNLLLGRRIAEPAGPAPKPDAAGEQPRALRDDEGDA